MHAAGSSRRRQRGFAAGFFVVCAACAFAGCGKLARTTTDGSAQGAQAATITAPVAVKAVYLAQFRAKVLVDGGGYSLYIFGPDRDRAVTCTGTCALSWPPLTVPTGTKLSFGLGVQPGLVHTIPSPGGADVVTYDGWPLYTYVADVSPGMASGQGINLNGGPWYLMRATGEPLVPAGQPLLNAPGSAQ